MTISSGGSFNHAVTVQFLYHDIIHKTGLVKLHTPVYYVKIHITLPFNEIILLSMR